MFDIIQEYGWMTYIIQDYDWMTYIIQEYYWMNYIIQEYDWMTYITEDLSYFLSNVILLFRYAARLKTILFVYPLFCFAKLIVA